MRLKMHFPLKPTRRHHRKPMHHTTTSGLQRSRRNAVIELSGDRERHLEQLFIAICSGDTDELTQILKSRATSTYTDTSSDLINCACATGNASTVQILLQHSVPFRSVGGKGDAPLHTAVRRGSVEIAKLLLDHGADVNVETKSERRTPLHLASASRKLDVLKYLLENEAEVDKVDIYGSTALHLAAEIGFSNGVSALLDSHADQDVFNRDGWTAMHLAAANGHLSVVEQLISAHATVDCQNRFGKTPLHWACVRGHLQVARVLLEHNASVDVRDKNEKTAFDHASTREIRNLIDATAASVSNLSVIPRITSGMHYAIGESTLRLTRVSAFVDALERARWSSHMSSDSGIDCPATAASSSFSPLDDGVFEEVGSRWSLNSQSDLRQRRRQRKTPIWSKPEDWRPVSAPVGSTIAEDNDLFQLPRQRRKSVVADGIQLTSVAAPGGRSISAFSGSFSSIDPVEVNRWLTGDSPQRSHSEPQHLEKARQLGRFLCPILELDDKASISTSLQQLGGGGGDETPKKNYGRERKRPSLSVDLKVTRQRPISRGGRRPMLLLDSFEEDSMKESRKSSDSDSDNTNTDSQSSSEYSCIHHGLTKDLEKILKRVSLAAVKDAEMFSGMQQQQQQQQQPQQQQQQQQQRSGVQTSHALIGALNTGLRHLLSQIEVARNDELDGDTLFSEA